MRVGDLVMVMKHNLYREDFIGIYVEKKIIGGYDSHKILVGGNFIFIYTNNGEYEPLLRVIS